MRLRGLNKPLIGRVGPWAALLVALVGVCGGACAGDFDPDVDLWPFVYVGKDPDKDERIVEVLGPFFEQRTSPKSKAMLIRPFYSYRINRKLKRLEADVLWPIGMGLNRPDRRNWSFSLVFWYNADMDDSGKTKGKFFYLLPFFMYKYEGENKPLTLAFWPFYGNLYNWYGRDRVRFVCWPFYVRQENKEAVNHSCPWPILDVIRWKDGGKGLKIWPFWGRNLRPARLDKGFVMWPFYTYLYARNKDGYETRRWMFWPFYGWIRDHKGRAETWVWPFFDHRLDRSAAYQEESWTYPWPFLGHRKATGKTPVSGRRFWPIVTWQRHGSSKYVNVLWPLIWYYSKEPKDAKEERDAYFLVLPFYQRMWETRAGKSSDCFQIWPVYQLGRFKDGSADAQVLALWPVRLMAGGWSRNWAPFFRVYHGQWHAEGGYKHNVLGRLLRIEATRTERFFELKPIVKVYERERSGNKVSASRWRVLLGLIGREREGEKVWLRFLWFFKARI